MRVLIVCTGEPTEPEYTELGTYDVWFKRHLAAFDVECTTWDAMRDAPPNNTVWDAIVVTGSPSSVHDRAPWSERCGAWCAQRVREGQAVFGVCYGHQLLADALGGLSGPNPMGHDYGVTDVIIDDDPLFDGASRPLPVYQIHSDAVLTAPPGARVLARSSRTAIEALAIGPRCRTVQWHPEFVTSYIRRALHERHEHLDDAEPGFTDRALDSLRELPQAPDILHNFMQHIAGIPRR